MKPYHQISIDECGEPLVPLPQQRLAFVSPHPYVVLGAPYGEKSPYFVRQGVLEALLEAQSTLEADYPGWRIQIFDAYRPVAVQQFMVDYTLAALVRERGLRSQALTDAQRQALEAEVFQFWAPPSLDLATPPPHSTGAAVDITLVDSAGAVVDMGSPIDEVSPRSHPDYFAAADYPDVQRWHQHRTLLAEVMAVAGFQQHPQEWWHFSRGDQLWAWLECQQGRTTVARYGRLGER